MFENNLWTMEPVGRPENTIQGDKYRFTLLTPCLIRMEYREDGKFEDRPTQVVWNRKFDPVEFRIEKKGAMPAAWLGSKPRCTISRSVS